MQILAVPASYFLRLSCSETLTSPIHRSRNHFTLLTLFLCRSASLVFHRTGVESPAIDVRSRHSWQQPTDRRRFFANSFVTARYPYSRSSCLGTNISPL